MKKMINLTKIKKNIILFIFIFACINIVGCTKQNEEKSSLNNILYNASIGMNKDKIIKNKEDAGYTDYGAVENTIIYNYMPDYFGYDTKFIIYEFDENDKLSAFSATFNEYSDEMYQIIKNNLIKELGEKTDEKSDDYSDQVIWNIGDNTVTLLYYQSIIDNSQNLSVLVNGN